MPGRSMRNTPVFPGQSVQSSRRVRGAGRARAIPHLRARKRMCARQRADTIASVAVDCGCSRSTARGSCATSTSSYFDADCSRRHSSVSLSVGALRRTQSCHWPRHESVPSPALRTRSSSDRRASIFDALARSQRPPQGSRTCRAVADAAYVESNRRHRSRVAVTLRTTCRSVVCTTRERSCR
jgi:hypothetical protein